MHDYHRAAKKGWKTREKNGTTSAWNKGLTKESDIRVAKYGRTCSLRVTGKRHSEETKRKIGLAQKGVSKNKGKPSHMKGKRHRPESIEKIRLARKNQKVPSGKDHYNWKGGLVEINRRIRHSLRYKKWRNDVFLRDNYTCQICGTRGVELHPDHIKPFAYFPRLRFSLKNGRTLCSPCHKGTDTYGYKARMKYERGTIRERRRPR